MSLYLLEVGDRSRRLLMRLLTLRSTSMSLRAPNVMRWTHCMDECLEILETSPDAFPSDKVLCQHIRLQRITEEAAMQLSLKDFSASRSSRAIQIQTSYALSKRQLSDWRNSIREDGFDGKHSLRFFHESLKLTNYSIFLYRCTTTLLLFLVLVSKRSCLLYSV